MIRCKKCKYWDGITSRSDQEPSDMLYGYCKMLFVLQSCVSQTHILYTRSKEEQTISNMSKFSTAFDFGCTRGRRQKKVNHD